MNYLIVLENLFLFYLELTIELIDCRYFFNLSENKDPLLKVKQLVRLPKFSLSVTNFYFTATKPLLLLS